MYFVFGHSREVQAEIKGNASTLVLLAVGIAVVLLLIFLSFENAHGATLASCPSLDAPHGLMEASASDDGREVDLEQSSWRSELKNPFPAARNS